jgi:hypothetical protein
MEQQRSDSNSKAKNVKNLNLAIDAVNRRAGSQEIDAPVVAPFSSADDNETQPQLPASQLSRSLSTVSRVTGSSRNDDQNNSIDSHHDLDQDGFQVVYSRKSRRTLSINDSAATVPPKNATVEGHVAVHEISAVFGNALPGTSFLASNMGRSSGQLQFIQHPNGDVSAHIWSGTRMQWENVGQFSNIRRCIEGQLAVCRLKGETANQMRRQNTFAYFRAVARQKEAELLGAPFGTADIKALLPDAVSRTDVPASVANQSRTQRRERSTAASFADDPFLRSDSRRPVGEWTPAVPIPSTHSFGPNAALSSSSAMQSARDATARIDFGNRKAEEVFLPKSASPLARSSNPQVSGISSSPRITRSSADTHTTAGHSSFAAVAPHGASSSLFDLGLVPQKPTIDKSSPAVLFFESLALNTPGPQGQPSAQSNSGRNVAEGASAPSSQPSVTMPDAYVRGALRGQLIRLGESAKGRSVSGTPASKLVTQKQSIANQASPAKTPFRTVLHDPYRTEQPAIANEAVNPSVPTIAGRARNRQLLYNTTAESDYFPNYTARTSNAAAPSTSHPSLAFDSAMAFQSQHALSAFDPFLSQSHPSLSAIDRQPLPSNTFDIRGSIMPIEGPSSIQGEARAASSAIREPRVSPSAPWDQRSLLQARHGFSTDPTFSSTQAGTAKDVTGRKLYDDRLRSWWNGDNKFQRQEDFYQRIEAAQRISSPASAKRQAPSDTASNNRTHQNVNGTSPSKDTAQFNGPLTRVLIPIFENLEAYAQPSITAAPDYWCPWTSSRPSTNRYSSAPPFSAIDSPMQTYSTTTPPAPSEYISRVPEWAIDRGPNGNDSFWDVQEWGMPPARVGRDTRYSSGGSGVGGFSVRGAGMGRSFEGLSSASTSPVASRGMGRVGGR